MAIEFTQSKYSQKAKEFLKKEPKDFKFITLLDGSVRSSKTVNCILKFVDYLDYIGDKGTILISGYSKHTVYKNFLEELFNFWENILQGTYNYNSSSGQITLKTGKREFHCLVTGAGKSDSENAIRGLTLAGWFADELTLHHLLFVKQALNRLSVQGAKVFATTNPDTPTHWVYKDYIEPLLMADNPRHKDISDIFELWHFTLDDNANLDPEYVVRIKKAYSGAFYERMINGNWVVAEGLVYPCFRPDKMIVPYAQVLQMVEQYQFMEYIAGIDWGFDHPQTASIIGITHNFEYYQICEYYERNQQPEHVIEWIKNKQSELRIYIDRVFPDSARADSCKKVSAAGFTVYKKPEKVAPSIDTVRTVMMDGRYFISDQCPHTRNELCTYRYPSEDEKLRNKFEEDKPLKENDDCMDGCLRYPLAGYELTFNRNRYT